ncbi:hypothetical protein B0T22DRAFT_472516 [Podospora appendiculata]|uniref:Uncharacterized protein n=1 Tax=Podospora appendiculata TaxID=314037 RepID=A0AAE0WZJ2_9PEZI|nr:hypothetical protein B0T22DRAFT_472516 [Podospora appendiculata]
MSMAMNHQAVRLAAKAVSHPTLEVKTQALGNRNTKMRSHIIASLWFLVSTALARHSSSTKCATLTVKPTTLTSRVTTTYSVDTHCPTVTSTTARCSTCIRPACILLSTISNPCDCSKAVPTVFKSYGCGTTCPGGCDTGYVYATSTSSCPSPPTTTPTVAITSPAVSSLPDSCTFRPTQTFYSSSGCSLTCNTGFCVVDAPVTVSCGCSRAPVEPTTVTVCPTKTPCYQCYTGWGTFLYTQSCTSSPTAL